jgi:hypothetical protein
MASRKNLIVHQAIEFAAMRAPSGLKAAVPDPRPLLERPLAIYEKVLGPEHPHVIWREPTPDEVGGVTEAGTFGDRHRHLRSPRVMPTREMPQMTAKLGPAIGSNRFVRH